MNLKYIIMRTVYHENEKSSLFNGDNQSANKTGTDQLIKSTWALSYQSIDDQQDLTDSWSDKWESKLKFNKQLHWQDNNDKKYLWNKKFDNNRVKLLSQLFPISVNELFLFFIMSFMGVENYTYSEIGNYYNIYLHKWVDSMLTVGYQFMSISIWHDNVSQ